MFSTRVHRRGAGRPTREDVARCANTSGTTVSRVLSGRTDFLIAPETRARVLDAAEQLGYRPNSAARALMNGRTGIVGFWMSLDYSPYRAQVLGCMRSVLSGTEMVMSVTDVEEAYSWAHSFDRALRVPVDGIIAFDNSASAKAFAKVHGKLAPTTPFVSIGAYWSEEKSFVGVDLAAGADAAMDHLLSTGRRRIAFMAPANSELVKSGPRYSSYQMNMEGAGLPASTIGIEDLSFQAVRSAIIERAAARDLPDAILCLNDEMAIAASSVLQRLGARVGEDIALVGFDGIEETGQCPIPITTVKQPVEEMCVLAWQFIQGQMEDPEQPLQQKILTPELVIRESSMG